MLKKFSIASILIILLTLTVSTVSAATDCTFTVVDDVMYLDGSCTTDETIYVPDGFTLEGQGYVITAVDPVGGHFTGAVLTNAGSTAYVNNVDIMVVNLANVCDSGDNRLRGVLFNGASGAITNTTIFGVNQGASGCQEGNAIEVRNAPFDGTHPNPVSVLISHNFVYEYQKTGLVVNGDVEATVTHNYIGSANLDDSLAANSIQFGYGASGSINNNEIVGNDWDGVSDYVGTAILLYEAGDVTIAHNTIYGIGTDVGILAMYSDTINVMNNEITRDPDDAKDEYGIGVWFYANTGKSKLVHNTFAGWLYDQDGADLNRVNSSLP